MSRLFNPTGEGSTYEYNPYSNPGRCGLEILGSLEDPHASYSSDTVVVWIDVATNDLYAARDSGCSCPSPFEDYRGTGDLTPVRSWEDVEGLIGDGGGGFGSVERFQLRRKVESYLGGMRLANQAIEEFRERYLPDLVPGVVVSELHEEIADLRESRNAAWALNDQYIVVIRDQGQFIEFIKQAIQQFREAESGGRF